MPGSGRQRLITSIDPVCAATRSRAAADPDWFIENFFYIVKGRAEGGGIGLLKYKHDQQRARELVREDIRDRIPVRHFRLKSRQVGMSTLSAAETFVNVWAQDYKSGIIIAPDKKRAATMLRISKLALEKLPPRLLLPMKRDSTEVLEFAAFHSKLDIVSATNFESQRGDTQQYAHVTEFAIFTDPIGVLQNLLKPMPYIAGTQVILETTGRLAGGLAHQFWLNCEEYRFRPIFFPWFEDPTCSIPQLTDREWAAWREVIATDCPDLLEKAYAYKLTREQCVWSYERLKLDCLGDELDWQREYPFSPEEAWISGGNPIFPPRILEKYRINTVQVKPKVYDPVTSVATGLFYQLDACALLSYRDRYADQPYLEVYKEPIPGRRYLIGADCAAGYTSSDFSTAYVIDMYNLEMMAEFHGRVEPYLFGRILSSLGYSYNKAILAPEINGIGFAMLPILKQMYPFLYQFRKDWDTYGETPSLRLGWLTNQITRPAIILHAKQIFLESAKVPSMMNRLIKSKHLIDELRTFVIADLDGKPEAASGCYDDLCFAWFIALYCIMQETYGMRDDEIKEFTNSYGIAPQPMAKDVNEVIGQMMDWGQSVSVGAQSIWHNEDY